jgi:hypothetical protein
MIGCANALAFFEQSDANALVENFSPALQYAA